LKDECPWDWNALELTVFLDCKKNAPSNILKTTEKISKRRNES